MVTIWLINFFFRVWTFRHLIGKATKRNGKMKSVPPPPTKQISTNITNSNNRKNKSAFAVCCVCKMCSFRRKRKCLALAQEALFFSRSFVFVYNTFIFIYIFTTGLSMRLKFSYEIVPLFVTTSAMTTTTTTATTTTTIYPHVLESYWMSVCVSRKSECEYVSVIFSWFKAVRIWMRVQEWETHQKLFNAMCM